MKSRTIKWTHKDGDVVYYPILEATNPLVFIVDNKDIQKAKKFRGYENPNLCVAACAVRRQNSDAIIQRDTAYLLQMRNGKIYAVRYRFGNRLRKAVATFDSKGIFSTGNYMLLAPTSSQTLEAKALRKKLGPITNRTVRKHTKFSARGRVTPIS